MYTMMQACIADSMYHMYFPCFAARNLGFYTFFTFFPYT